MRPKKKGQNSSLGPQEFNSREVPFTNNLVRTSISKKAPSLSGSENWDL